MLRVGLRIALACWLTLTASADALRKWTDTANMGLRGRVHTQRFTSKKLREDPRSHPKLHIWSPIAWMVFDSKGHFIEQANMLDEDGKPQAVSRMKRDAEGRIVESSSEANDRAPTWHNEFHYGPHGVIENRTYRGQEVQVRQTTDYDARGNAIEIRTYDAAGDIFSRACYRYDDHDRVIEWRVFGIHNEFHTDMVDRYDQAGDIAERMELNGDGRPIRILVLNKNKLVWWWQDPNCNCSGGIGWNDPEKGVTTSYEIQADGTLETTVENHPGRYGNVEVDDMQRFASDGGLLEKLTFRYERDPQGNWVARTISAWDPKTNTLIPIQEDHRTMTYY